MTFKPLTGLKSPNRSNQLISTTGLATTQYAPPPIQVSRWARNGATATAQLESAKAEAGNFAAMFRTKEVFRYLGNMRPGGSNGAGDYGRWRWAFHTGPYTRYVQFVGVMWPPSTNTTKAALRLDLTDANSVTTSQTVYYGSGSLGTSFTQSLSAIHTVTATIAVTPDTDYTAHLVDVDNGITTTLSVYELASLTEFFSGYLPQNVAIGGTITDLSRQNIATLTAALWRRGGAQLLNWAAYSDAQPITGTQNYLLNLFDQTSTSPGPNTGGYYLDLSAKARRSQRTSGVPVVMKAYVNNTAGAPTSGGTISLVNQAGVAQLSITSNITSAGWVSTTGTLPATLDKYDLMFQADETGTTFNVYAVSVYE